MGSLAPFHSQTQKMDTRRMPEINVAITIADLQGNVIPPWSILVSGHAGHRQGKGTYPNQREND